MALLDHTLGIARIVFSQDESGSKTTLTLVRPEAMGGIAQGSGTSSGDGGILPPAEKQKDAQAEAD